MTEQRDRIDDTFRFAMFIASLCLGLMLITLLVMAAVNVPLLIIGAMGFVAYHAQPKPPSLLGPWHPFKRLEEDPEFLRR